MTRTSLIPFLKRQAVWLWMTLIFIGSVMNPPVAPEIPQIGFDKLVHVFFYFILTILLSIKIKDWLILRGNNLLVSIIASSLYGCFIEWVQGTFFPTRHFEFTDIFANIIGGLVGILFIYFFTYNKSSNLWGHLK